MNTRTFVAISIVVTAPALGAQKAPDITPYLIADRAAEVALARTAAPSAISENATVLVLTPKGYTEAARGTNGFTCLVMRSLEPALTLGVEGRRLLRDKPLEHYIHELSEVRRLTLDALAARDDEWLERPLIAAPAMNAHFAWFHVAEDEINHRGQMRWLRARLGSAAKS
ncbi:MAG: hypothetical protein ACXVAW_19740 [Vulcanimicrobiaceae bacterium]